MTASGPGRGTSSKPNFLTGTRDHVGTGLVLLSGPGAPLDTDTPTTIPPGVSELGNGLQSAGWVVERLQVGIPQGCGLGLGVRGRRQSGLPGSVQRRQVRNGQDRQQTDRRQRLMVRDRMLAGLPGGRQGRQFGDEEGQ